GIRRIDRQYVEIAVESQMLKTIVQNKSVNREFGNRPLSGGDAIRIGDDSGGVQKILCEQKSFVARDIRRCQELRTVRHNYSALRIGSTVTASQYANLASLPV